MEQKLSSSSIITANQKNNNCQLIDNNNSRSDLTYSSQQTPPKFSNVNFKNYQRITSIESNRSLSTASKESSELQQFETTTDQLKSNNSDQSSLYSIICKERELTNMNRIAGGGLKHQQQQQKTRKMGVQDSGSDVNSKIKSTSTSRENLNLQQLVGVGGSKVTLNQNYLDGGSDYGATTNRTANFQSLANGNSNSNNSNNGNEERIARYKEERRKQMGLISGNNGGGVNVKTERNRADSVTGVGKR